MAVFTDHVQLPNPVLEDKTHRQDEFTCYGLATGNIETLVHSVTGRGHTAVEDL